MAESIQSEYHRCYRHPDEVVMTTSQEPMSRAGLSSAELAVALEPAFSSRRKLPGHNHRKVTFTDCQEHVKDKDSLKYRAGFRREHSFPPTEYKLQYSWKSPLVEESPLVSAEVKLHSSSCPAGRREVPSRDQAPAEDVVERDTPQETGARPEGDCSGTESRVPASVERGGAAGEGHVLRGGQSAQTAHRRAQTRAGSEGAGREEGEGGHGDDTHGADCPGESGGGVALTDGNRRLPRSLGRAQCHDKTRNGVKRRKTRKHGDLKREQRKPLLSEYTINFKAWPIGNTPTSEAQGENNAKESKTKAPPPAGSPQRLTDSTDPRLLKHSPQPAERPRPHRSSAHWRSDYAANFTHPSQFAYVDGVFREAPWPKPGPACSAEKSEADVPVENSWFCQVSELREKAETYRCRAEGSQLSRSLLHLSQQQQELLQRADGSSSSSTSASSSSVSFSQPSASPLSPPASFDVEVVDLEGIMNNRKGLNGAKASLNGAVKRKNVVDSSVAGRPPLTNEGAPNNLHPGYSPDLPSGDGGNSSSARALPPEPTRPRSEPLQQTSGEESYYTGRVPTPVLRTVATSNSAIDMTQRHHLDVTTPTDGGLLVSPVKLPFPPASPKFRRDMRSSAPVFPSPQTSHSIREATERASQGAVKSRSVQTAPSWSLSFQHPATAPQRSSSRHAQPTHSSRVNSSPFPPSHPPHGAVRQLNFDPTARIRSGPFTTQLACTTCQPSASRPPPAPPHCTMCGAHLRHSSPAPGSSAPGQPPQTELSHSVPQRRVHLDGGHSSPSAARVTRLADLSSDSPRPGGTVIDPDQFSVSSLSLSTCSVASDVLRRARDRKHFWMGP